MSVLLAGLVALAQPASQAGPSIPFTKYELDNGLEVILSPDGSTPIVYVTVWYHVGSKDEGPGLSGFAHLFEHLMFQGSLSNPGEYFEPLMQIGATVNGSTTTDRTNYHQVLPAEELPLALWLESDRMGWLLDVLDQATLDEQRGVVRNERRENHEQPPYAEAWRLRAEALYPEGHPYHHMTIGTHEDLQNASLDDVKAFFRTWYVPNNATLAIVGDFDEDTAKQLVTRYFAAIPRGEEPVRPAVQPVTLAENSVVHKAKEAPEPRAWLSWHSPKLYDPGDADLDVFAAVLADGKDSRLYRRLVEELGVARDVGAWQGSAKLAGSFTVSLTAAKGHTVEECVKAADEVLAKMLDGEPPTKEEVTAAVNGFEAGYWGALTTISGKGEILQSFNDSVGDPGYLGKDLARYRAVTPATATAAAREWLTKHRVEIAIVPEVAQ